MRAQGRPTGLADRSKISTVGVFLHHARSLSTPSRTLSLSLSHRCVVARRRLKMERHHLSHQQREMESSSQQWHHHRNDQQMMGLESYRSNQQMQMEMESSSQRLLHHRGYQQQMEMDSSLQRWPHHRSNQQQMETMERHHRSNQQQMERESRAMLSGGLGLGLAFESGNSGLPDLMMGPSPLFGPKPAATLDFLGLGIGGTMGGSTVANRGLPALMIGGELDMGSSAQVPAPWEDAKRKTNNGRTIL